MDSPAISDDLKQILLIKQRAENRLRARREVANVHWPPSRLSHHVNILQINCNKSHHVLLHCIEQFEHGAWSNLDVLCLSEPPFDRTNRAIHACGRYRSLYWLPSNEESKGPMSAIVLLNPHIQFEEKWLVEGRFRVSALLVLNTHKLLIHSIYVPASGCQFRMEVLKDINSLMTNNNCPAIILGDFNLKHRLWTGSKKVISNIKAETDLITKPCNEQLWYLLNTIGLATRFSPTGISTTSTIDLAFASQELSGWKKEWERLDVINGTDHFPCKITLHKPILKKTQFPQVQGFNWKMAEAIAPIINNDLSPNFQSFYQIYNQQKEILIMKARRKEYKVTLKKMDIKTNLQVRKIKANIRKLRRRQKKDLSCQLTRGEIRKFRKQLATILARKKKVDLCTQAKTMNSRNCWKHLPIKRAKKKLLMIIDEGNKITEPSQMLEAIMDFAHPQMAMEDLTTLTAEQIPDCPPTEEEVNMAIRRVRTGTATGEDAITVKFLKKIYKLSPKYIQEAYIKAYQEEIFPVQWLQTRIIVLPKSQGSETKIENTRLIGIPSTMVRVLHNIIQARLLHWTIKNKVLDASQHGVLPNSSTITLLETLNQWISPIMTTSSGQIAIVSKVDIKKAFDTVQFGQLIKALTTNNFPTKLIAIITKLMASTTDVATLDDIKCTRAKQCGTIQGCSFSPILFSILLAGVLKKLRNFAAMVQNKFKQISIRFLVYLDDLILVVETEKTNRKGAPIWSTLGNMVQGITAATIETYQNLLAEIGLSIAPDKLEHLPLPKTKQVFTATISKVPLKVVQSLSILGITYSAKNFAFNTEHVENQTKAGNTLAHDLYQLGRFVNLKYRTIMIKMAIIDRIMYAAQTWGHRSTSSAMKKLEVVFRTCMRKATKSKQCSPNLTIALASSILPASILVQKLAFIHSGKKHGLYIDDHYFQVSKLINPITIFHPANIPKPAIVGLFKLQKDMPQDKEHILHLFTDASITNEKAGFAILEPKSNRFLLYKTHNMSNSFAIELMAIEEAIAQIEYFKNENHSSCIIFSDSLSAIQAINNPLTKTELVIRIRQLLEDKQLTQFVQLAWVKAHSDIINNQLVDLLASAAAEVGKWKNAKVSNHILKICAAREVDRLMEQFFLTNNASHFKFFFPTWKLVRTFLHNPSPAYLNFLNSQETYLRSFAMKMKDLMHPSKQLDFDFQSPLCECDASSVQDSVHIIFACRIFNEERSVIMNNLEIDHNEMMQFQHEYVRNAKFYKLVKHFSQIAKKKLDAYRNQLKALSITMQTSK